MFAQVRVHASELVAGRVTRPFDDAARAYLAGGLWAAEEPRPNGQPRDIWVRRISVKAARPLIATHHYSRTMPDATREVFAGYFPDNTLAGLIAFGMGAGKNQYVRLLADIADGEYRELSRLWSPDGMPKNTESRLIAAAIRLLDPSVRLIVSYADPAQGHLGRVYQATNFLYLGMTDGGERLVDESGQEVHSKLLSVYRMRHPEMAEWTGRDIAAHYGFTTIPNPAKHRYVYARRPDDRAVIAVLAEPYPRAVAASSDAPGIQPGEGGSQPTSPLHHPRDDGRDKALVVGGDGEGFVVETTSYPKPRNYLSVVQPPERDAVRGAADDSRHLAPDTEHSLSMAHVLDRTG